MNNNRGGQNQNHQRKYTDSTNHSQFAHSAVPVSNPSGYIISGQRGLRQYLNAAPHNVSDMKNNHMPNMTHGQIQMVQTHIPPRQQQALPHHLRPNAPRNLPRGPIQYQVYLPNNVYQGSSNPTAFYQYNPQQGSPAVIMPFIQNYSTNQAASMYYSTTQRPLQMANIPQGPQNPSVANMSNVQNSHGPLIVQPQPVEMASNTQSLQVTQPPSTASMQPSEPRPQKRRNAALKIIDPNTGNEIDLNNTQALPSADELEKMKVQSQFQSLVQSVVKKDDAKVSDNQSNEGGEKVRNEFQSQVKKLLDEEASIPSKPIEVNEAQLPDETLINPSILPKNEEITAPIINSTVEDNSVVTIDLSVSSIEKSEEVLTVNENNTEISLPTTAVPILVQEEISQITTDSVTIIPEEVIAKKITDEESSKPAKPKKSKGKKKKSTVKENEETINIVPPSVPEVIKLESANNTHENKENENDNHNLKIEGEEAIKKSEEILQQPTDTQDICVQPEVVIKKIPKLPSYLKNLPYEEGQWSITNTTGKKRYSKLFLTQLGSEAVCQKKPDVLKTWGSITKSSSSPQFSSLGGISNLPRSQSASASSTFLPSYFKPGNNSQRGSLMTGVKRNSSQGKTASKTSKPNTIHMSLSLREEVKLNQTENAWVPTAAKKATKVEVKNKNEEELTTEDVNKSVRSILNKITPDNMIPLTERFKALPIDSYERLTKTIDLVFEKAIEEQSFAPLYASLCHAMQNVQVSSGEGNKISFKKLIISKCQSLFELDKAQEMDSAKKLAEINSCKDPENKKELQIIYDENERRLRKRSVGNCRFIGELFKQKILTPNIMLYCIVNLVTKHEEEPLECLCNLLKTVGKELEQSFGLAETFDKLQALTSKEMKSKIPSRIRFMIQDVIDLRRDKWIPRRNDSKPKLINEIENDAKNEAIEQSMARESYRPEKPRDRDRDHHRGDDNKFRGGDNKSRHHSQFAHSAVPVPNPSGYIISGQRGPRQYLNAAPHNVSDMKNNHMPNMTHGQIQMVQAHIPPRQQAAVYLPNNVYQGSSNPTAFYQYNPQQGSPAVIMPFIQNYSTNQAARKMAPDECLLNAINIKSGTKIMMVGSKEEDIAEASVVPPKREKGRKCKNHDSEDFDEERVDKMEIHLAKIQNRVDNYEIKMLNNPRPGKKLLVLDIDYTLFDHRSVAESGLELMRPYLHFFLESAYENYDIVIWSATDMRWIERKMAVLNVANNVAYKIMFYLDNAAMITVHTPKYGVVSVKPLGVIWGKFPDYYNKQNTLMFDDIRQNFLMNPKNGLKIRPFREAHLNWEMDKELLHLAEYLVEIAKVDDFTKLNHRNWEKYIKKLN